MLSRLSICERASIDECYLDISAEAARRLAAASGHPQPPVNADRIHVAGQACYQGSSCCVNWVALQQGVHSTMSGVYGAAGTLPRRSSWAPGDGAHCLWHQHSGLAQRF